MNCRTTESSDRVRRFDVNAAMVSTAGRTPLTDIELAPAAAPVVVSGAPAAPSDTRLRDLCISVGIAIGIVTVIGVLLVVDPF